MLRLQAFPAAGWVATGPAPELDAEAIGAMGAIDAIDAIVIEAMGAIGAIPD